MSQKREGEFFVLEDEEYDSRIEEHQEFVETMQRHEFTNIKTLKGNRFSIPFQDIWTNPEQTHQVYFVYDPILNTNYIRINGSSDNEPKSISELGGWFTYIHYTELSTIVLDALEDGTEDEQAQAIFNFAIGFYVYDSRYPTAFEKYLKSPSIKVRLAAIRAIGFQLWNECIPLLEKVIQEDSHRAVRNYASEIKRQIQQPDFDPNDVYEYPENYPNSLERVTDKAFQILPQLKNDLQVWMKERGINLIDALDLYQYLDEAYGESKLPELENDTSSTEESLELETIGEQKEPENTKSKELPQLQQKIKQDKKQLKQLRSQLKQVEARIEDARRTNIFSRPQSGDNEREKDKLTQEIDQIKQRIAHNKSLLEAQEQ